MKKKIKSKYKFEDIRGIQSLERLSYVLGEDSDYLIELSVQKNSYYKPFISREKGKKDRLVDQPTGELIRVQTKIRDRLLNLVPLSKITFGAVQGMSTIMSAEIHIGKNAVVKMDLKNCFHSSKSRRVKSLFKNRFGFSEGVTLLLTELCTYEGHVPVGSTLSSTLVNLILNPLWEKIDGYLKKNGIGPSTWIDDLSFSGKSPEHYINMIKKMINDYGYAINWDKLKIERSNSPMVVNGLCVNSSKATVPKKLRIKLKSMIKDNPSSSTVLSTLAYIKQMSPTQGRQLEKLQKKLVIQNQNLC